VASATAWAKRLFEVYSDDIDELERIDDYLHGKHDDPWVPDDANQEYRLLVERSITNGCPLLVNTPAQALYVDNYRRGEQKAGESEDGSLEDPGSNLAPEMKHWQDSGLDARQLAVHRGAIAYGHAFTLTEKVGGKIRTRGLSALLSAGIYRDPANDIVPEAFMTITRQPTAEHRGTALMWHKSTVYDVTFRSRSDFDSIRASKPRPSGARECPITRFAASVDLEGRTVGVIAPMMALQNRINQTVFDLLLTQTYSSTKVRTVTGMAPPIMRDPITKEPIIDPDTGLPRPKKMNYNASRFLMTPNKEAKFGTLDETPLDGFISSVEMSIRQFSAFSQTPPHYLLGQIANLSAEALQAAEIALARKVSEFQVIFGESWERVFRLAAELAGDTTIADDHTGEVIWRDMEQRSLAQAADGLGKLREQLQIPAEGLWKRVPNITAIELAEWRRLREEQPDSVMADALRRSSSANLDGF
jgi:hypothetical protein